MKQLFSSPPILFFFITLVQIWSACDNHRPDELFDIRFSDYTFWDPPLSNFLVPNPIDYPPVPPTEYCTIFKHTPEQFTSDDVDGLRIWLRKSPDGCTDCWDQQWTGGELVSQCTELGFGYYSFILKMPDLADATGLWLEFGLSNVGASRAVVWGVMGRYPDKGYLSTTVGSKSTEEPFFGNGIDSRDGFHEYGLLWNAEKVQWWIDGHLLRELTDSNFIPEPGLGLYIDFYAGCGVASLFWIGNLDDSCLPVFVGVQRVSYFPGETERVELPDDPLGPGTGTPPSSAQQSQALTSGIVVGVFSLIGLLVAVVLVMVCIAVKTRSPELKTQKSSLSESMI